MKSLVRMSAFVSFTLLVILSVTGCGPAPDATATAAPPATGSVKVQPTPPPGLAPPPGGMATGGEAKSAPAPQKK